jgi:beta-N-acetylhexosaminidase
MYGVSEARGNRQSLGFLMVGIAGLTMSENERSMLLHPAIAGVILFSRNYADPDQLSQLTHDIHSVRHPRLLIAVDHEGGRVQRFKSAGFTHFPAAMSLGKLYDEKPLRALELAHHWGCVMASELLSCGVDFTFAPVVDLDYGNSSVIGDRALHHNPHVVAELASHMMQGMNHAGMTAVAKHFPGHGHVVADTHHEFAQDTRSMEQLLSTDIQPYKHLMQHHLGAIMMAHVVYPAIDDKPAGLSSIWIQSILRQKMHYQGAVISDDLGMLAVAKRASGEVLAQQFLGAGCDLVLLCNDIQQRDEALLGLIKYQADAVQESRLIRLHGNPRLAYPSLKQLHQSAEWLSHMKVLVHAGLVNFEAQHG